MKTEHHVVVHRPEGQTWSKEWRKVEADGCVFRVRKNKALDHRGDYTGRPVCTACFPQIRPRMFLDECHRVPVEPVR